MTFIINQIFSKQLPNSIYMGVSRQLLIILSKGERPGVRPIMISDCWFRLMESCVTADIPSLSHHFQPLQMAVGAPGGNEDIIHLIRASLDARPHYIVVKTDFTNAYGSLSRKAIFNCFRDMAPSTSGQLVKWYLNLHLSKPNTYLTNNGHTNYYSRGVAQGSPLSMFLFCTTIHQALVATNTMLQSEHNGNGILLASADDTTFIGPPEIAFKAALFYASQVSSLGLQLNPAKSEVLCPNSAQMKRTNELSTEHGFQQPKSVLTILGAPVGAPNLEAKAFSDEINPKHFERLNLMENAQAQLLLLRYSLIGKYMYLTRCVPPDASKNALATLSSHVNESLASILDIPHVSFTTSSIAAMPLSVGGLGLTDLSLIRFTAYYASASHALHTWTQHLGATHPIIASWTGKKTRSSTMLEHSLQYQHDLISSYNVGKIIPDGKYAPNNANIDKADPESLIPAATIPALPFSITTIAKAVANNYKIQRALSHIHAIVQFRKVWRATSQTNYDLRTQLLANTARSTNLWLRVTPDNPRFRLSNFEFRYNLLQHFALDADINVLLGLSKRDKRNVISESSIPCICTDNDYSVEDPHSTHHHQPARKATYAHLVNCRGESAFNYRHNCIINVCAEATKAVNLQPEIELKTSTSPAITGNNNQKLERKRFDVTVGGIAEGLKTLQLDVSVTSHRQTEQQYKIGCSRYPLYAADSKVTEKANKYKLNYFPDTEAFVALVCETSGAIHKNYHRFFASLALRNDNQPPPNASWTTPTFITYWLSAVSCTLRRESARALQRLARAALRCSAIDTEDDQMPLLVPRKHAAAEF